MDGSERVLDAIARLERKIERLARLQAVPAPVERLLPASQVDRLYRLRRGTAAAHCRAGELPHISRKARHGERLLIDPADAARVFAGGA